MNRQPVGDTGMEQVFQEASLPGGQGQHLHAVFRHKGCEPGGHIMLAELGKGKIIARDSLVEGIKLLIFCGQVYVGPALHVDDRYLGLQGPGDAQQLGQEHLFLVFEVSGISDPLG